MVKCSRCAQLVDETVRSTCPHCFTPLQLLPQQMPNLENSAPPVLPASAPPVGASPTEDRRQKLEVRNTERHATSYTPPPTNVAVNSLHPTPYTLHPPMGSRVALTGEVIEYEMPESTLGLPPANAMGYTPPGLGGVPPVLPVYTSAMTPQPVLMAPPVVKSRMETKGTQKQKDVGNVVSLVLLILIAIGGMGSWYQDHSPAQSAAAGVLQTQVTHFYDALRAKDWKTMASLTALPEEKATPEANSQTDTTNATTPEDPHAKQLLQWFQDQVEQSDWGQLMLPLFVDGSEVKVGDPMMNGDKADVPVTATLRLEGEKLDSEGQIGMIKVGGVWKVDLVTKERNDLDHLLGQPDPKSLAKVLRAVSRHKEKALFPNSGSSSGSPNN